MQHYFPNCCFRHFCQWVLRCHSFGVGIAVSAVVVFVVVAAVVVVVVGGAAVVAVAVSADIAVVAVADIAVVSVVVSPGIVVVVGAVVPLPLPMPTPFAAPAEVPSRSSSSASTLVGPGSFALGRPQTSGTASRTAVALQACSVLTRIMALQADIVLPQWLPLVVAAAVAAVDVLVVASQR
jgi:hypothetical protein